MLTAGFLIVAPLLLLPMATWIHQEPAKSNNPPKQQQGMAVETFFTGMPKKLLSFCLAGWVLDYGDPATAYDNGRPKKPNGEADMVPIDNGL